jgi:RimJ/RimL family protein N-acetyltransferase
MRLTLHVPSIREMEYRQKLLADPDTMSYNAGYDLGFPGYHNDTGCIDFPQEKWAGWYERFIGREPEKFYAYVERESDGAFIGEVVLRQEGAPGRDEMGVVIEACHRGKGYSAEAMHLLMDTAFNRLGAEVVCNDFERSRAAALRLHLNVGFEIVREDDCVHLELKREWHLKRFG